MLQSEDLKTFVRVGKALWVDPVRSERSTVETLAAVTLLHLTPERELERAAASLLTKAKASSLETNLSIHSDFLNQNFFCLTPEERFLLVVLHLGRWSYARLGRILGKTKEEVQELAWAARLELSLSGIYPSGPSSQSPQCPAYDPRRPWTQRFLDEEISSRGDLLFLQSHLQVCAQCNQALARCRNIYYKIDREITDCVGVSPEIESLQKVLIKGQFQKYPSDRTLGESLKIFFGRPELRFTWIILGTGLSFCLFKLTLSRFF